MARACPHSWFRPRSSKALQDTEDTPQTAAQQEQPPCVPENKHLIHEKAHDSDQDMQTEPPAKMETNTHNDGPPTNTNDSAQMEINMHNDDPPGSVDNPKESQRLLDTQGLIIRTPSEQPPCIPNPPVPPSQSTDPQPSSTEPSPLDPGINQTLTAQSEEGFTDASAPQSLFSKTFQVLTINCCGLSSHKLTLIANQGSQSGCDF